MSSSRRTPGSTSRVRLTREARNRQLLDVAWRLVRQEGSDALTLGRLAEQAGVTKPVVYDHFGTRNGLLAALYREFDTRQNAIIDAAIEASAPTLGARAKVLAETYVDCVLAQGSEIPGVIAALGTAPELEGIRRECDAAFIAKCSAVLAPFAPGGSVSRVGLRAMLGAAEALSSAAASGEVTSSQAKRELFAIVTDMVARQGAKPG